MDNLENELKLLIVKALELEDLTPDEIDSEEALFVDGLGLDSIDALELGMVIQKTYGVKIDAEDETIRSHFANVKSLADFVRSGLNP